MKNTPFRQYAFAVLIFFNIACDGNENTSKHSDAVEAPVNENCQSKVFNRFLSLPDSVFEKDPHFNRTQIEELVCQPEKETTENAWKQFAINENKNLFSLYHNVEPIFYQFIDAGNGGLLLYQHDGNQNLRHFLFDEESRNWSAGYDIPFPDGIDFYSSLDGLDQNYIAEWSLPTMIVAPDGNYIEFMLMQKAQQDSLGYAVSIPPSDLYFEMHWNQDSLWLEKYLLEVSPVAFR